jgi:hypothetical protein
MLNDFSIQRIAFGFYKRLLDMGRKALYFFNIIVALAELGDNFMKGIESFVL